MKNKIFLAIPAALLLMGASCSQVATPPQLPSAVENTPAVNVAPAPVPPSQILPTNLPPANSNAPAANLNAPAANTNTPPAPVPPAPTSSVKSFNVSAVEFSYTPSSITVSRGNQVKIIFTNNGSYPHNLTIRELNIATKTLQPGESDTLTFTAPSTAQSMTYYCSVDSHESLGLKGTILVQ